MLSSLVLVCGALVSMSSLANGMSTCSTGIPVKRFFVVIGAGKGDLLFRFAAIRGLTKVVLLVSVSCWCACKRCAIVALLTARVLRMICSVCGLTEPSMAVACKSCSSVAEVQKICNSSCVFMERMSIV